MAEPETKETKKEDVISEDIPNIQKEYVTKHLTLTQIGKSALAVVSIGVILFCVGGLLHIYGTRGIKDAYRFTYQGKPAAIQRVDRRWDYDSYFLLLNGRDKMYEGEIITDDGKLIKFRGGKFSVREANETEKAPQKESKPQIGKLLEEKKK